MGGGGAAGSDGACAAAISPNTAVRNPKRRTLGTAIHASWYQKRACGEQSSDCSIPVFEIYSMRGAVRQGAAKYEARLTCCTLCSMLACSYESSITGSHSSGVGYPNRQGRAAQPRIKRGMGSPCPEGVSSARGQREQVQPSGANGGVGRFCSRHRSDSH